MRHRFSALLVQNRIVSIRDMDAALRHQKAHGGTLGTNLLEVSSVEEPLLRYTLGQVMNLPPADDDLLRDIDPRTARRIDLDTALETGFLPLRERNGWVEALVTQPLSPDERQRIEDALGTPVKAFVTLEFRFRQVAALVHGSTPDERYASLDQRLPSPATLLDPGRLHSSDADDDADAEADADHTPDAQDHAAATEPEDSTATPEPQDEPAPRLDLRLAIDAVESAPDRRAAVRALLDASLQVFHRVALLARRGDQLRLLAFRSRQADAPEPARHDFPLPDQDDHPLHDVLDRGGWAFGTPRALGAPDVVDAMGGDEPAECALLPVPSRGRTLLAVLGDQGSNRIDPVVLPSLLLLYRRAGEAIARLIVAERQQPTTGDSTPQPEATPESSPLTSATAAEPTGESHDSAHAAEAAPEDAAPEDAAPEDAAPEDAAPEDAASPSEPSAEASAAAATTEGADPSPPASPVETPERLAAVTAAPDAQRDAPDEPPATSTTPEQPDAPTSEPTATEPAPPIDATSATTEDGGESAAESAEAASEAAGSGWEAEDDWDFELAPDPTPSTLHRNPRVTRPMNVTGDQAVVDASDQHATAPGLDPGVALARALAAEAAAQEAAAFAAREAANERSDRDAHLKRSASATLVGVSSPVSSTLSADDTISPDDAATSDHAVPPDDATVPDEVAAESVPDAMTFRRPRQRAVRSRSSTTLIARREDPVDPSPEAERVAESGEEESAAPKGVLPDNDPALADAEALAHEAPTDPAGARPEGLGLSRASWHAAKQASLSADPAEPEALDSPGSTLSLSRDELPVSLDARSTGSVDSPGSTLSLSRDELAAQFGEDGSGSADERAVEPARASAGAADSPGSTLSMSRDAIDTATTAGVETGRTVALDGGLPDQETDRATGRTLSMIENVPIDTSPAGHGGPPPRQATVLIEDELMRGAAEVSTVAPGRTVSFSRDVPVVDAEALARPVQDLDLDQPGVLTANEDERTREARRELQEQLEALNAREPLADKRIENLQSVLGEGEWSAEILRAFPGRLFLDRHAPNEARRPVDEHGPLLRLMDRNIAAFGNGLVEILGHGSDEARYYAFRLLARHLDITAQARYARTLVFDSDPPLRNFALHLLEGLRGTRAFDLLLDWLRRRALEGAAREQELALSALFHFRDEESVPVLIELLQHPSARVQRRAHQVLGRLTCMDFDPHPAPWSRWYARHGHDGRLSWLLEAMTHTSPRVRENVARALRDLPGLQVDYHPDASRRDQLVAKRVVEHWYQQQGSFAS